MALVLPADAVEHVLRHVDRHDHLRRGAHRRGGGGRARPGAGRRRAGRHAQVRPGARRAAPDLHRRAGGRRARPPGRALRRHPRTSSARYTALLDSVRADRAGVLRLDLLAPVGFLAPADYDGLFAPLRPTPTRPARNWRPTPGTADRRVHAVPARPADRPRPITTIVRRRRVHRVYQDSDALVTALLTEPELIADRTAAGPAAADRLPGRGRPRQHGHRGHRRRHRRRRGVPGGARRRVVPILRVLPARRDRRASCASTTSPTRCCWPRPPPTASSRARRPTWSPGTTYHLTMAATGTAGGAVDGAGAGREPAARARSTG